MDENRRKNHSLKHDALLGQLAAHIPQKKIASPCPDESLLAALAEGKIRGIQKDELFDHLADCSACRETYSLLRLLAKETHGRIRVFRPMALAASFLLVLLTVYVLYDNGTLGKEDAPAQAPTALSIDEKESRSNFGTLPVQSESAGREAGAVRHEKVSGDSIKEGSLSPAKGKSPEKRESLPVGEETEAAAFRSTVPAPAKRRVRPLSCAADALPEKRKKAVLYSEISPEPPPEGTPPGKITITLYLSADNRISDLNFEPRASLLIPPLRRAFLTWNPRNTQMSGSLRFSASWNGKKWKIQTWSPSGGNPAGAPEP